jgi:HNH endonuclease/NUMOD4 motif-containing protein
VSQSQSIVPLNGEEWKGIPSTNGRYQASSFGRVRSVESRSSRAFCRVLKAKIKHRYLNVHITLLDRDAWIPVHRLIAEAFFGQCPKEMQVNHRDGNKTNNQVANLEYVTPSENMRHSVLSGLRKYGSAYWNQRDKAWAAQICIQGKSYYLGLHASEDIARNAISKKVKQLQDAGVLHLGSAA